MDIKDYKRYFLGRMSAEDAETLELRTISSDETEGELLQAENDLIEDYLDGTLSDEDIKAFNTYFLVTKERRERVELVKKLISYAKNKKTAKALKNTKPDFFEQLKVGLNLRKFAFTFGGIALILTIGFASYLAWKSYSGYSDNSEISILLNKSFKNDRPTEARITGFDYAPKSEGTRGNGDKSPELNLVSAKSRATEAVLKNETAENFHELGRVYLAEKNFDEAVKQFEKAIKLNPNIAAIHNDLGAALMEKAGQKDDGKLELLAKANEEIEKSIELDQNLVAAYFNRGLVIESLNLPNQAKEAWESYLKLDSSSQWADEAREHLQKLEKTKLKDISAIEFENEFITAFHQRKDDKAFQLVGETRELIKEKYLPQKLAMSFSSSNDFEKLQALKYLGKLEKERIQDNFAFDLSVYYADVKDDDLVLLKKAQSYVAEGYSFCLKDDFSSALDKFILAKKLFLQAGNFMEANAICQHFIAYCFYNLDKKKEALILFGKVDKYCRDKNYKWLYLSNFYWFIGWNYGSFDYKSITKVKNDYEKGLKLAREIGDSFLTQKYLISLAYRCFLIKQNKQMLNYLQQSFEVSQRQRSSLRQKFRNFSDGAEMLASTDFNNLSKLVVAEEIEIARESEDVTFIVYSQLDAGIVQRQTKNFETARKIFIEAESSVENIKGESEKKELLAQIYLNWGHLERETGNYRYSAQLYDKSLAISEMMETPVFIYETKKSRLLAYQSLGEISEVENQLPSVIEMAEKYRDKILEEQERHSFFENEQTIYDIAVEHYLNLGETEKAFNYAELSSSRSLLDWLKRGATLSSKRKDLEVFFDESETPLTINEIREQMPSEVQIVQYTVLEKKILIWLVSKEKLVVVSSEISSDNLKDKVKNYLVLINSENKYNKSDIEIQAKELYQYLISPILSNLDKNKEICFVPSKILVQLPFSALLSPDGKYFLSGFSLFYAPSSNVFLIATKNAKKKSQKIPETILSIGNPLVNVDYFPELQNLTSSENEAKDISSFYETSHILTGKEATKSNFQHFYQSFDVIHFAGHYIVEEGSPLLSGLILADEGGTKEDDILTNSELLANELPDSKLVILSACQTGVEGYYNGEGMIGLSRTFLSSGVPIIVASQWKVDSTATNHLMTNFHRYRTKAKLSTTQALRQAQLDMLDNEQESFQSPYFWAAFSVFGGYANF